MNLKNQFSRKKWLDFCTGGSLLLILFFVNKISSSLFFESFNFFESNIFFWCSLILTKVTSKEHERQKKVKRNLYLIYESSSLFFFLIEISWLLNYEAKTFNTWNDKPIFSHILRLISGIFSASVKDGSKNSNSFPTVSVIRFAHFFANSTLICPKPLCLYFAVFEFKTFFLNTQEILLGVKLNIEKMLIFFL